MAHTPGPWHADSESTEWHRGAPGSGVRAIPVWKEQQDRQQIPVAWVGPYGYLADSKADARLIAAAPDMLAALRVTLHFTELALGAVDVPNDAPGEFAACAAAINDARAAIAKAEGR